MDRVPDPGWWLPVPVLSLPRTVRGCGAMAPAVVPVFMVRVLVLVAMVLVAMASVVVHPGTAQSARVAASWARPRRAGRLFRYDRADADPTTNDRL